MVSRGRRWTDLAAAFQTRLSGLRCKSIDAGFYLPLPQTLDSASRLSSSMKQKMTPTPMSR